MRQCGQFLAIGNLPDLNDLPAAGIPPAKSLLAATAVTTSADWAIGFELFAADKIPEFERFVLAGVIGLGAGRIQDCPGRTHRLNGEGLLHCDIADRDQFVIPGGR